MNIFKCLIAFLLIPLFLSGCMPPSRIPVSLSERSQIKSDQLVVEANQKEIVPDIGSGPDGVVVMADQSLGMNLMANLLLMGVEDGIQSYAEKKAKEKIKPIQALLSNYNFMGKMSQQLNKDLQKLSWLKLRRSSIQYNVQDKQAPQLVNASKENSTLLIKISYGLGPDFNSLNVNADVNLYRKNGNSNLDKEKIYSNTFMYSVRLAKRHINSAVAIQTWLSNNGSLLKSNLQQAIVVISEAIVKDMLNTEMDTYKKMTNSKSVSFLDGTSVLRSGKLMSLDNDLSQIRFWDGTVFIVNSNSIKN